MTRILGLQEAFQKKVRGLVAVPEDMGHLFLEDSEDQLVIDTWMLQWQKL